MAFGNDSTIGLDFDEVINVSKDCSLSAIHQGTPIAHQKDVTGNLPDDFKQNLISFH